MRKERDFPFVDSKVKIKGEIATDEYGIIFLPPILWEKVIQEVRKRESQKFWGFLKKIFKRKSSKKMAVYKTDKPKM